MNIEETRNKCLRYYSFYRTKCTKPRRVIVALNLCSVSLTTVRTVLAPFTSLFTLVLSRVGMVLQTYCMRRNLPNTFDVEVLLRFHLITCHFKGVVVKGLTVADICKEGNHFLKTFATGDVEVFTTEYTPE